MNPSIFIASIAFGTFIYFIIKPLVNLRKDRKIQESLMSPNDLQTDDLRIVSKYYRSVIYNFGNEYDYLKFQFTENEVFVFMRNSFPGIYHGPFLIKEKTDRNYSYLGKLDLKKFSIDGNNIKISFGHKKILGMSYTFYLKNVSEDDINLLKLNLC